MNPEKLVFLRFHIVAIAVMKPSENKSGKNSNDSHHKKSISESVVNFAFD